MNPDQEICRIVWEEVSEDIKQAIVAGRYRVYNGVVRDATDGAKLVKHLPLRPIDASEATEGAKALLEVAQGVEGMQTLMTGLVAVSTVAIMGAIVASTAYLSHKIAKLQAAINQIQKEIHDQNVIFYAEKVTQYFGVVEALREVCAKDAVVNENRDLILMHLANVGAMRNQIYYFIDAIVQLSDNFSIESKVLAIDFVNRTLDMIPKAVCLETQAAYKVERFALGDEIRHQSQIKYNQIKEGYRLWCNEKVRQIHIGKVDAGEAVLLEKKNDIRFVIESEENRLLLDLAA